MNTAMPILTTWTLVASVVYAAWQWPKWPRPKTRPYDWARDGRR